MTSFDLPLPPSTNQLFFNVPKEHGGGRAKTKRYLDWITLARSELRKQKARPLFGQFVVRIECSEKSRADLGNHEKPVVDLLVFHGVLEDDSKKYVRKIILEWSSEIDGVRVIIEPAIEKRKEAA